MSVRADAESLRQIPFSGLRHVPLQVMAFCGRAAELSSGRTIIGQGKKAKAAFFIMWHGRRVRPAWRGKIGSAEPGAMLGEVAMIGGALYAVTAIANESITAARIDNAACSCGWSLTNIRTLAAAVFRMPFREKLDLSVKELDRSAACWSKRAGSSDL
jgi:hypothetical protein